MISVITDGIVVTEPPQDRQMSIQWFLIFASGRSSCSSQRYAS